MKNNLDFGISLIQNIHIEDIPNLFIKREDLLPFSFGGNKLRICIEFLKDMKRQHKDCIIGYGSFSSNLCRVLANLCSYLKIKCFIVYSVDENTNQTFNSKLVHQLGAEIITCPKEKIADAIDRLFQKCSKLGLKPYYIYGNKYGKGNEHVFPRAYCNVYQEIIFQEKQIKKHFDYIFLPSGTGMTQSGLIAGLDNNTKKQTHIIGISIARDAEKQKDNIKHYLNKYCLFEKNKNYCEKNNIHVTDDYLLGGYGIYNSSIEKLCKKIFYEHGIPMDVTYVGKAFYGMLDYIKKDNLERKNILFINTGGLPLFFEHLKN